MNTKAIVKLHSQRYKRNKDENIKHNTASSQTPNNLYNQQNININYNDTESLDWGNYESIYNNIISYINLMIIDLIKDKEKLCKYLKKIFYSIFKISQEIKLSNPIIKSKKNNLNSKQSSSNEKWNFLTGEQFFNNNNNIKKQSIKEEKKNEKNSIGPFLTQRIDNSKSFNNLRVSPLKTKIDRLQRKFRQKEKQYKLDKLNYLLRINEQNSLIDKLEKEIQINNINNITQEDFNKIKCYPEISIVKENYLTRNNSINNNQKIIDDFKEKENKIINNIRDLSITNTNSNKEKKKYNLKDIFSKNLFLLKNKGKMNKTRFMRFTSFSFSDTKTKVKKIMYYK